MNVNQFNLKQLLASLAVKFPGANLGPKKAFIKDMAIDFCQAHTDQFAADEVAAASEVQPAQAAAAAGQVAAPAAEVATAPAVVEAAVVAQGEKESVEAGGCFLINIATCGAFIGYVRRCRVLDQHGAGK